MVFNHYLKIKNILSQQLPGWYIKVINEPTIAKKFNGELQKYDHYYRIYDHNDKPIKFCKFQQLDRLSRILDIPPSELPVIE
jgi:hypothetical protein